MGNVLGFASAFVLVGLWVAILVLSAFHLLGDEPGFRFFARRPNLAMAVSAVAAIAAGLWAACAFVGLS